MIFRFGPYRIDSDSRVLLDGDAVVRVPPKAFDLLLCLVEHQGSVVPKEELFARVWPDTTVQESSLAQAVLTLRRSLKPGFGDSEFIESVPRRGYRLTVAAIPENDDVVPAPVAEAPVLTADMVKQTVSAAPVPPAPASASLFRRSPPRRYVLIGMAALALVVLGLTTGRLQTFYQQPFDLQPLTTAQEKEDDSNISADGKHVVFAWRRPGEAHYGLWIKTIGEHVPVRLTTGDADDRSPVWAPDRPVIGFIRSKDGVSEIRLISANGVEDRPVGHAATPSTDLAWSPDGKWLAVGDRSKSTGIRMISLETSVERQLTSPAASFFDSQPKFSPDGKTLGFVRHSAAEGFSNVYSTPVEGGSLLQITGVKRLVRGFDWTEDGREVVYCSDILGNVRLFRTRVSGEKETRWVEQAGFNLFSPSLSRRGGRLTFTQGYIERSLFSAPGPGSAPLRSEPNPAPPVGRKLELPGLRHNMPVFSPDGSRIAFVSDATGSSEIWVSKPDGSDAVAITTFDEGAAGSPAWSPDGKFIVYDRVRPSEGVTQAFIVPSTGGAPRQFTTELANHTSTTWSVDGKWIYYTSLRSGPHDIWRQPVSGGSAEQITHTAALRGIPSRDGKYIYYVHPVQKRIWRALATGGSEEVIPEISPLANTGNWNLTARGIYWEGWDSSHKAFVYFFDFATRKTAIVAADGPEFLVGDSSGIAVSPDDKVMILARIGKSVQHIMVADGFR